MRYTTFRYNAETCQYERVRLSVRSVLWYSIGLVAMGSCMLVGILLIHDQVVSTTREIQLRKENKALQKHHAILTAGLNDIRPVLASLQQKDQILHTKFFGTLPVVQPAEVDYASKQDLLLADGNSFRKQVTDLKGSSEKLRRRSAVTNRSFANQINLTESALANINALPTLQPVQDWETQSLISGFGMRVNPFHKGLYEHLGVDLALPRGSAVIATGSGRITQLKRSDLQAGYGNYIEVDHGNGIVTRYAHLEEIVVKYGASVHKGEKIGTVGTSGGSVAPHLHYEVLRDGKNVDPIDYMLEKLSPAEHYFLTLMSHQQNQSLD